MEANENPEPTPAPRSRLTQVLAVVSVSIILGNLVLLSAWAGSLAPPGAGRVLAGLAGLGVLGIVLGVPLAAGSWLVRSLSRRGRKVRRLRTMIGLIIAFNFVVLLAVLSSIERPAQLVRHHGTWLPRALLNGPALARGDEALPVVRDLMERALSVRSAGDMAELLTNESATALAVAWLARVEAAGPALWTSQPAQERTYDAILAEYGFTRDGLRSARPGAAAPVDRGRALLGEVSDLLDTVLPAARPAGEPLRTWSWRATAPGVGSLSGLTPAEAASTLTYEAVSDDVVRIGFPEADSIAARAEDGAWRLAMGGMARHVTVDIAAWIAGAEPAEVALAAEPPPVASEPMEHTDVRAALQAAAAGHAGHLALTTAYGGDWPDSLTREAAAASGLHLLRWCGGGDDPIFQAEAAELRTRYRLGDAATLDPTLARALVPRGRDLLGDVLRICAPVVRQRQASLDIPDARRARWAGLDAADTAERAVITDAGPGVKQAAVDGATWQIHQEDGAWRVHWPVAAPAAAAAPATPVAPRAPAAPAAPPDPPSEEAPPAAP